MLIGVERPTIDTGVAVPRWLALVAFVASGLLVLWGVWTLTAPPADAPVREAFRRAARVWAGQPFPRVTLPTAHGATVSLPLPGPQVLVFFRVFT
ncbi:MAG: hypothetical protein FJY99_03365 [Candidatus Sericytochromatia bacterium]|nr:hypothetical protein [Candidatus Tanganyikabacteria bacterium]